MFHAGCLEEIRLLSLFINTFLLLFLLALPLWMAMSGSSCPIFNSFHHSNYINCYWHCCHIQLDFFISCFEFLGELQDVLQEFTIPDIFVYGEKNNKKKTVFFCHKMSWESIFFKVIINIIFLIHLQNLFKDIFNFSSKRFSAKIFFIIVLNS